MGLLIGTYVVLHELACLGAIVYTFAWESPTPVLVSCPECKRLAERGGFQTWQIVCAITFFPFGLLALLSGRKPTVCGDCGFRWSA
jgi:hypothetical protein